MIQEHDAEVAGGSALVSVVVVDVGDDDLHFRPVGGPDSSPEPAGHVVRRDVPGPSFTDVGVGEEPHVDGLQGPLADVRDFVIESHEVVGIVLVVEVVLFEVVGLVEVWLFLVVDLELVFVVVLVLFVAQSQQLFGQMLGLARHGSHSGQGTV